MPLDGILYLAVNDDERSDNAGEFIVSLRCAVSASPLMVGPTCEADLRLILSAGYRDDQAVPAPFFLNSGSNGLSNRLLTRFAFATPWRSAARFPTNRVSSREASACLELH